MFSEIVVCSEAGFLSNHTPPFPQSVFFSHPLEGHWTNRKYQKEAAHERPTCSAHGRVFFERQSCCLPLIPLPLGNTNDETWFNRRFKPLLCVATLPLWKQAGGGRRWRERGKEWKEGPSCPVPCRPPTPCGLWPQLSPPCSGAGRSHLGTVRTGASTAPHWLPTPAAPRSAAHCFLSGSAAQSPTSSRWQHCGAGARRWLEW